jgi:hypothetical protein
MEVLLNELCIPRSAQCTCKHPMLEAQAFILPLSIAGLPAYEPYCGLFCCCVRPSLSPCSRNHHGGTTLQRSIVSGNRKSAVGTEVVCPRCSTGRCLESLESHSAEKRQREKKEISVLPALIKEGRLKCAGMKFLLRKKHKKEKIF